MGREAGSQLSDCQDSWTKARLGSQWLTQGLLYSWLPCENQSILDIWSGWVGEKIQRHMDMGKYLRKGHMRKARWREKLAMRMASCCFVLPKRFTRLWSCDVNITEYKWHNFYIFNILSQGDTGPYRIADFVKY